MSHRKVRLVKMRCVGESGGNEEGRRCVFGEYKRVEGSEGYVLLGEWLLSGIIGGLGGDGV